METLFGFIPNNATIPKDQTRRPGWATSDHEIRVLDPKKSQNIAILLRALNVTMDEVSEALLDGMATLPPSRSAFSGYCFCRYMNKFHVNLCVMSIL